jgi:RNA polymerase sigma-70 factor (ECF subfamily)
MPAVTARPVEEIRLDIEMIYRVHGPAIARWVASLGGPEADVEDLVQEVFVVVQEQLPRFRGRSRLTTWLYGIASHVVSNRRRRRWFGKEQSDGLDRLISPTAPLEEAVEAADRRRRVYAVLDRLNERQRTLLVLFEIEERSGEEVAELLGVRLETVWVRLHRARAEFLKQIRQLGWEKPLRTEHLSRARGMR